MQFTPETIFSNAQDRHPGFTSVSPGVSARQFNVALEELISDVAETDPARLSTRTLIPNATVTADPDEIDLSSVAEWLRIESVDFMNKIGGSPVDQVVLGTLEARHRLKHEYEYLDLPIGYVTEKETTLVKVHGWDVVKELQIHGARLPATVTPGEWSTSYDFPAPMVRALSWKWMVLMAPHVDGLQGGVLNLWIQELERARDAMGLEAKTHLTPGAVVEDVPPLSVQY